MWTAKFFVLDNFLPSSNNPKKQNFEKMKEKTGDITILHNCTINDNHMMYGSWNMKRDGQKFLLFWTVFCPLTHLTTQKIKILKNWTKFLNILFYTMSLKSWSYAIPFHSLDMARNECNCYFSFWAILPFYLPNNLKNQN